jgi:AcrR family transcriptional regulator
MVMADLSSLALQLASSGSQRADKSQTRMLDAARDEFINHGIARTSVANIARRAGVSRPTLYRQCGDKDQIVAAVVRREVIDFFARAYAATAMRKGVPDKMVEVFVMGMREAREHPLVRALKDFETETFTRRLAEMDTPASRGMISMAATMLADSDYSGAAIERALDFSLRITATLLLSPSSFLPTENDEHTREFAQRYLIPIIDAARGVSPQS